MPLSQQQILLNDLEELQGFDHNAASKLKQCWLLYGVDPDTALSNKLLNLVGCVVKCFKMSTRANNKMW
jgi:hypothetical protein